MPEDPGGNSLFGPALFASVQSSKYPRLYRYIVANTVGGDSVEYGLVAANREGAFGRDV